MKKIIFGIVFIVLFMLMSSFVLGEMAYPAKVEIVSSTCTASGPVPDTNCAETSLTSGIITIPVREFTYPYDDPDPSHVSWGCECALDGSSLSLNLNNNNPSAHGLRGYTDGGINVYLGVDLIGGTMQPVENFPGIYSKSVGGGKCIYTSDQGRIEPFEIWEPENPGSPGYGEEFPWLTGFFYPFKALGDCVGSGLSSLGCYDLDYDFGGAPYSFSKLPDVLVASTMRFTINSAFPPDIHTDYCSGDFVLKEYFCMDDSLSNFVQSNPNIGQFVDPETDLARLIDCSFVYSDGTYDETGGTTGARCISNRCACPAGKEWLPDGTCGVPCSADLNTAGKTIKGVVGASTKFEIDDQGHAYFDGTIIKNTAKIASNGGFIMKDQNSNAIAAFDKDGNLRLPNTGTITENSDPGDIPLGIFTIKNNGENVFSINIAPISGTIEVYSKSCIHEADNAVGGISEDK